MLCLGLRIPAELRLDARFQHIQVIGLCDIVIAAAAETLDDVVVFVAGSQEDDRCLRFLPQNRAEIHAVAVRQHDIQQNQIRHAFLQQKRCLLYGIRTVYIIAFFFQKALIDPHDVRIVLDKQNMCHNDLRDYKIVILFDFHPKYGIIDTQSVKGVKSLEKERSKSRSLRRKLLIALISSLIAVLGICTVIFNMIYQQASVNVNLYSGALAGQTVSAVSDAYYQQFLSAQQQYLRDFGREMSLLLYQDNMSAEARRDSLQYQAVNYFSSADVFFLYDGEALCSYEMETDAVADAVMQKAAAVFDQKAAESPELYGYQTDFSGWLDACMKQPCGTYAKEGAGYIIAWDNMLNYSGENLCFGVLMQAVNDWVEPIRNSADEQTESLLNNMDSLFRKYMYMMILSVICVFALFLVISAILSKKIADPVVSEHDMLVQVNEMKTTFLSDASHELKTPLAAMSGYAH